MPLSQTLRRRGVPGRTMCAPTQSPIQSLSSLTLASLPETNMQSPARNT